MKFQSVIISYAGGVEKIIASGEIIEASREEYETAKTLICGIINTATYFDMGNVIVPGEFFRNSCVIKFLTIL